MKRIFLLSALLLFATIGMYAQDAKYEIKSGIIKKSMERGGGTSESVTYFDDYGKSEATTSSFTWEGNTRNMRSISKDGKSFQLNITDKTYFESNMRNTPINFLKLTQEVKDQYKIKELGDETVAGKPCKKYSYEVTFRDNTSTITVWVWKGITLKTASSFGEWSSTETATEIQENATVDAALFAIPSDYTLQERSRPF
jgi:hypothetical protein